MLAAFVATILRMLAASWRVHAVGREAITGPVVYAFLHGELLGLSLIHRDEGVVGMVSRSRDGERLSSVLDHLGYAVVRGSSSRGGARAALEAMSTDRSVAIAVDGPRGPAGVPKPGAAFIATRRGIPLACVRVRAPASIRLDSWDRFRIPLPFARIDVDYTLLPGEGPVEGLTDRVRDALVVHSAP